MGGVLMRRLACLALGLALLSSACARSDLDRDSCAELDSGAPVDPVLLAFLSSARAAHHIADAREQAGDLGSAVAALEKLTQGPRPAGAERPEVREVLADTQARLADLYGRQGKLKDAFGAIDRGLALAAEPTYFRGHLYEVRGQLEERQAEAQGKLGNEAEAKAARERGLSALEEAMRIQQLVIEKAAPARNAP